MFKNPFNDFVKAVKSKNLTDVERKFKSDFLNKQDNEGYYPIHLVCLNNSVDIFKFFLKQNCDVNLLDSNRNRPIHCAIKTGSEEIVKLLLGFRCSIDDANELMELAKTIPTNRGRIIEILEKAIENRQNDGYYPIHLACLNNSVDIFKFFLKQNCDIDLLDSNGNRPIHCAIKAGSVEIVKLLLGYRCSIDDRDELLGLAKTIPTNRGQIIEILEKAIENRKIGIEMDLKCSFDCDHKFCLISFMMIEFDKGDIIDCGAFGKVYKVVDSIGKRVFAMKKVTWKEVEKDNSTEKENSLSTIKRDAKWLENNINDYKTILSHEHIIKYFGAIKEDYKLLIFMEFAENGSIHNLIENLFPDGLPYDKIIKYSKHILLALDYLHTKDIIHRDIKSANILLDKYDNCKLTDLGFSRLLETISKHKSNIKKENSENQKSNKTKKPATTYCGTANYMAPEIINGRPYSFPCDLWSLGGTVIEMLTGKPPYYQTPQNAIILKIGRGEKYDYESLKPTTEQLKNLIDRLVNTNPDKRKTAGQLLTLDLFKNME